MCVTLAGCYSLFEAVLSVCLSLISQEFQSRLPTFHSQLLSVNVISDAYAVEYFTTAFIYSTQYPCTLRIWDLFLLEGAGVLFEVGWAVMKCVSDTVGEACVKTPDTALQVLRQSVPQLTGRMIFQVCLAFLSPLCSGCSSSSSSTDRDCPVFSGV